MYCIDAIRRIATKSLYEAAFSDEIQTKILRVFLLAIDSRLYSFDWASNSPLTVSRVQLLYTVKEKGGKPDRKPENQTPFPMV